jgi:hypothetical protein
MLFPLSLAKTHAKYTPTIVPIALMIPITIPAIAPPFNPDPLPPGSAPLPPFPAAATVVVECDVTRMREEEVEEARAV